MAAGGHDGRDGGGARHAGIAGVPYGQAFSPSPREACKPVTHRRRYGHHAFPPAAIQPCPYRPQQPLQTSLSPCPCLLPLPRQAPIYYHAVQCSDNWQNKNYLAATTTVHLPCSRRRDFWGGAPKPPLMFTWRSPSPRRFAAAKFLGVRPQAPLDVYRAFAIPASVIVVALLCCSDCFATSRPFPLPYGPALVSRAVVCRQGW